MKPLAIYIHYPFCSSLCPYCDFNVYIKQSLTEAEFVAAIEKESAMLAASVGRRVVPSIFLGGGTPSLLSAGGVEKILQGLAKKFTLAPDIEITLEANPENAQGDYFSDLASVGVNRLSLGVQSLDDDALAFLGRKHQASEAAAAIACGKKFFANVSFDLIYARGKQSVRAWEGELSKALAFAPHHLSLYQLEIHAGTPFSKSVEPTPDERAVDLWEASLRLATEAGLARYEISNFARVGFQSKHNLAYWLYQDYAGLGPGAHGRVSGYATLAPRKPLTWARSLASANTAEDFFAHQQAERLSADVQQKEKALMGLRLTQGIRAADFTLNEEKIKELVALGLLEHAQGFLKTTNQGALVLDSVAAALLT